jgi:DNA-binding response OmpR family regulator
MFPFSILSIGYDGPLLDSRSSLLRSKGFRVASARSRHEAIMLCGASSFDLVMLCTSIPPADADRLQRDLEIMRPGISTFNFAVWDQLGLPRDPESLLKAVQAIRNQRNGHKTASEDGELQEILMRAQHRIEQQQALAEFRRQLQSVLSQRPDEGTSAAGPDGQQRQSITSDHGRKLVESEGHPVHYTMPSQSEQSNIKKCG